MPRRTFDHVDVVVSDVERSLAYGGLFEVDDRHECLVATGAAIESAPKEYEYIPGYYAVFFYGPDGIKLELVHVPDG